MAIFYGFVAGLGQWPHFVILNFIGAMLGRFYFQKRFGEAGGAPTHLYCSRVTLAVSG